MEQVSETIELKQGHFEGWAIVEMMGHRKEIGYVTTESFGAAVLFRVDQPAIPGERERTLRYSVLVGDRYCPAGTKVKYGAIEARTVLVAPSSLYALNPCTESAALAAIEANIPRPVILLDVPQQAAIAAAAGEGSIPGEGVDDDENLDDEAGEGEP